MAILAIFTGKGITKSHYEALRREVDWVHRRPEGMIFHAAAFDTAGGIRVADVWESQAALDDFFDKRLWINFATVGIADTGFIFFVLVPGYTPVWPSILGPGRQYRT